MMPTLIAAWCHKRRANQTIAPHNHPYHELVFYRRGKGTGTVDGTPYTYESGHLLLLPPHVPHSEHHEADGEVCCIEFMADGSLPHGLFHDGDHTLWPLIDSLLQECQEQPYGYRDMIAHQLAALLLCIERLNRKKGSEERGRNLAYAVAYLDNNYREKIALTALAERMHLSYDYFRHRFAALTGLSPQQYLTRTRLRAAAELLRSSDLNCTEIALRCGFSGSAQFSALFKSAYGLTPSEFRKAERTEE